MAWVIGGRDTATFNRLYDKVKHQTNCIFYADNWDAFTKVLSKDHHIIGKSHTVTVIEGDSSNTRYHLGRMTGRTRVVSKKIEMTDVPMKLW